MEITIRQALDFIGLDENGKQDLIRTMACYEEAHIEYANGKQTIQVSHFLLDTYAKDFEIRSTYNSRDFYEKNWYFDLWYRYVNQRKAAGEPVNSAYFEENIAKPYYDEAYNRYLQECIRVVKEAVK